MTNLFYIIMLAASVRCGSSCIAEEGMAQQPLVSQQPGFNRYFRDFDFSPLTDSEVSVENFSGVRISITRLSEQLRAKADLLKREQVLADALDAFGKAYRELISAEESTDPFDAIELKLTVGKAYRMLALLSFFRLCSDVSAISKQGCSGTSLVKLAAYTDISRRCRRFFAEGEIIDYDVVKWQEMLQLTHSIHELAAANKSLEKIRLYLEFLSIQQDGTEASVELMTWSHNMAPSRIWPKLRRTEKKLKSALYHCLGSRMLQFAGVKEILRAEIYNSLETYMRLEVRAGRCLEELFMCASMQTQRL